MHGPRISSAPCRKGGMLRSIRGTFETGGKQYVAFPVGGGPLIEELIAVAL
jgi:hypothetical protein